MTPTLPVESPNSSVVVLIPGNGVIYTVSGSAAGGLIAAVGYTLGIVPHLLAAGLADR